METVAEMLIEEDFDTVMATRLWVVFDAVW